MCTKRRLKGKFLPPIDRLISGGGYKESSGEFDAGSTR